MYINVKWFLKLFSSVKFSGLVPTRKQSFLTAIPLERTRNFCIIAHVDHGKSTLADRFIELSGLTKKVAEAQLLDNLPVERQRGITVKAQTVSLVFRSRLDGHDYLLNLIDTPGHVDFSYEVSRSLRACQGAILLVDSNEGVQAQTVANFHLAKSLGVALVPVLNKIDLPLSRPQYVERQLLNIFGIDSKNVLKCSAKTGYNVDEVLQAVIDRIPHPPAVLQSEGFKALLFDCWYDQYKGIVLLIAITHGEVRAGMEIVTYHNMKSYVVQDVGLMRLKMVPMSSLKMGQVGYLVANMKTLTHAKVGDTVFAKGHPVEPLAGFKPAKPMVFGGFFPLESSQFSELNVAIQKLCLTDASVQVHHDNNVLLGQGFRLGFLGVLHMDVFSQRLQQEYNAQLVMTTPNVPIRVRLRVKKSLASLKLKSGVLLDDDADTNLMCTILNPASMPEPVIVEEYQEPFVIGTLVLPQDMQGTVTNLCLERRGHLVVSDYLDDQRLLMRWKLPLAEVLVDFFDQLRTITSGYCSVDYEDIGYESSRLVKLLVLVNGQCVDEFTSVVHTSKALKEARRVAFKLKNVIPQQLYTVAIQVVVNDIKGKIIARENISALKKDVLAKMSGGDQTRKNKLLAYQREGKARMKMSTVVHLEKYPRLLKRSAVENPAVDALNVKRAKLGPPLSSEEQQAKEQMPVEIAVVVTQVCDHPPYKTPATDAYAHMVPVYSNANVAEMLFDSSSSLRSPSTTLTIPSSLPQSLDDKFNDFLFWRIEPLDLSIFHPNQDAVPMDTL